jgi:hypothetical protein
MIRNNRSSTGICTDDFSKKLVVITGATSGIGYFAARKYASQGANHLCTNRNQKNRILYALRLKVNVAKTRQQAQNLSTIIILVMSAIGGSMIPLFIMPAIPQKIALLSVNYWGIQGFYDIFWRGLPLQEILPKILILMSIGLIMTLASIRLFKKRITKL